MNENQSVGNGMGALLGRAGISRAPVLYIGIGLALIALAAIGAYVYLSPAAPAEIAAPPAETTEANISEASENPAEKIPETNPFKKANNPFDSYTNPFE